MLKSEDIANVSFRRANLGGYRPDDVDAFIDQVQLTFDQMRKEREELAQKLDLLAQKVEEYRRDEESIRTTLLNAQKLADASVREAKHKSEVIIKDATIKGEKIVANARYEVEEQQKTIEHLQQEVANFRSRLLAIYKEHLTLIDALPTQGKFSPKGKEETKEQEPEEEKEKEDPPVLEGEQEKEQEPGEDKKTEEEESDGFTVKQPEPEMVAEEKKEETPASIAQRFGVLKFGEDYDLSKDEDESPLGLFDRK